jgi:diguanylate cyclase (GGDEF)-like protein
MKNKFITAFVFIILIITTIALIKYIDYTKEQEIKESNEKSIHMALVAYNSIINTNKIAAQSQYNNLLENKKAMEILKKFKDEIDEDEKTYLRGELFRVLNKKYQELKKLGIRQLHFHTHKGESLLRFHKPTKSGDSLIGIRKSIEYVNKKHKPFFGFEGGKIFPGFRYVFPIFYNDEHLGSVEFSVPFELIEQKLQSVLPKIAYQLHLNTNISYNKVFDSYKTFFVPSVLLKNHYIENSNISMVENKIAKNILIQNLQTKLKPLIDEKLLKNDNFSLNIIYKNHGYRSNFITIKELDGTEAAHLVCYCQFDQLLTIEQKYLTFKILIFVALLIIIVLLYIVFKQINKIIVNNKNIQQLLDYQDNIVILTNGSEINFANFQFLRFFGFKDLNDFKKHHKCICEYFSQSDRFFHLGKIKEDENWVEVINSLPNSQRVVSMLSQNFNIHAFSVTVNRFDDNFMIMSFTDISQTMLNYIELEEKTIHDKLTNALNREYFEQNYEKLIGKYHTKDSYFAIAMLDIDHFKKVNDTHGHDVGDDVLIHFVKTIQKYSREEDILIRWGGEEFIFILKVDSRESLLKALEHIRKIIELEEFPTIGHKTCSIGGTLYFENEDIEQTIKRADIGVYEAKASGRNRVIIK